MTTAAPTASAAFAPPTADDITRWREADQAARPRRLAALRARMADEGIDLYFGVRRENIRYLTGFELGEGEEKVAGNSGQFIVSESEVVVFADSRYTVQAAEQCPDARIERVYHDLTARWRELMTSFGSPRRVAFESGFVSHAMWQRLAAAVPDIDLVPVEGWVEAQRQVKEPSEIERIAAACAVADAALQRLLPAIKPGVTEAELALQLEWEMRTNGAEALAFDVACLSGPQAALPHGAPGSRQVAVGEVLLFDFGAQVAGYRSDMTRTLFIGEPRGRDLEVYTLVARTQQKCIDALTAAVAAGERPVGREIHMLAVDTIRAGGHGEHFGHSLGHGIGLATHEMPSLGASAPEGLALPSPTVFSVEPGVYLDGEMGVRIEDLVSLDADRRSVQLLTRFPREVTVVG